MTYHFKEEPMTIFGSVPASTIVRVQLVSIDNPFEVFFTSLELLCWPGIVTDATRGKDTLCQVPIKPEWWLSNV